MEVEVKCHGCSCTLKVCGDPVLYRGKKLITPKLQAPFICDPCRADKKKLNAAREEQWKFIGKPEPTAGWEG